MDKKLGQLASGLLVEVITAQNGVDLSDMDLVVDRVVRELGMIVITDESRWPKGCGEKLRPLVTDELGRLLRQRQLVILCDRPYLYIKAQAGMRLVVDNPGSAHS